MTQPPLTRPDPPAVAWMKRHLPDPPNAHLPGEVGVWVFILGDLCVFGVLFIVFVAYRGRQPELFTQGQDHLHRIYGLINTILLLTSSLAVATAVRAVRGGIRRLPELLFGLALLCGLAFLFNKYLEWSDLFTHHLDPSKSNFYMYFFVLTGIHAFHVIIGICVLAALIVLSHKETRTPNQQAFLEGGACFWHMVDLLWIVLFALLYLAH